MDSSEFVTNNIPPTEVVTEEDILHLEESCNDDLRSDMPAQIEKNLEFIAANRNGHILLGSSNLTGRYWCGSVWYYLDPFAAPDILESKAALEFQTGVTDCVFIDDTRAIVAQDGGMIDFIAIKDWENQLRIERTEQIEDHGYSVTSVKLMSNEKTAITASMDMGIRLWDCDTTACTHNFTPAHNQEVTSVSPHPNHPQLFLSSSLDGNVLLWDLRVPKPSSCVFRDIDDCPSSVAWVPSDASDSLNFVVGTLSGEVHLRCPKVITHSLTSVQPFQRAIYRISPNRFRFNQVAVCANETKVQVITVEDTTLKTSYCNDQHTDFVRGLEWLNEFCLLSCGWDKAVHHHSPL